MLKLSMDGAHILGTRLGYLNSGFMGATFTWFLDWLLPSWLKFTYMFLDQIYRASSMDRALAGMKVSYIRRLAMLGVWLAILPLFRSFVPNERCMVVYHGVFNFGVGHALAIYLYLQHDGPPGNERMYWIATRDAGIVYVVAAYSLTDWSLVSMMAKWIFLRVTVPVLCAAGMLYVLAKWVDVSVAWRAIRNWLVHIAASVAYKISPAWDRFDVCEAKVMEQFPKYLQQKWSTYRQTHPNRTKLPTFQYQPLLTGEIRLLVLEKGRFCLPGVIKARIIHAPITYPTPEYEAVSYRWGSSDRTDEILVDGCRFPVTKSAFELLLARRSVWRERTIWIDAICINQNDDEEKSVQVQLMRDIYYRASRVVVCPGGGWKNRYAAPLIYELFGAVVQFEGSELQFRKLYATERRSPRWVAMVQLFSDEYFNRAWVIQEIAVGRQVELYFGGLYIQWEVFCRVLSMCFHPHRRSMLMVSEKREMRTYLSGSTFENVAIISLLRPGFAEETENPDIFANLVGFESLLLATSRFRATDPRDKIFALLGIASGTSDAELVRVDYSKPVERVFLNAMLHGIFSQKENGSTHLLALAGTGFKRKRSTLPSWVPDFSEERLCFPYTDIVSGNGQFRASGHMDACVTYDANVPGSLFVKCVAVDRILDLSPIESLDYGVQHATEVEPLHLHHAKCRFVFAAIDLCMKHRAVLCLGAEDEADYQSLITDRLSSALVAGREKQQLPSSSFPEIFRHWLQMAMVMNEADNLTQFTEMVQNERLKDVEQYIEDGSITLYDLGVTEGSYGRRFAVTKTGKMCVVPPLTKVGDEIVIPFGSQTPFVIRKFTGQIDSKDERHELVGEAFMEESMLGESSSVEEDTLIQLF